MIRVSKLIYNLTLTNEYHYEEFIITIKKRIFLKSNRNSVTSINQRKTIECREIYKSVCTYRKKHNITNLSRRKTGDSKYACISYLND